MFMKHLFILFVFIVGFAGPLAAQSSAQSDVPLDSRVTALESKVPQLASEGLVSFLFGAFCALWAMNTGRNAWLWFFLGLIFSVIAVLVLLNKNSEGRRQSGKRPFHLQDFRKQ
jgi:cell division protein FtsW (lipid II flippase)